MSVLNTLRARAENVRIEELLGTQLLTLVPVKDPTVPRHLGGDAREMVDLGPEPLGEALRLPP